MREDTAFLDLELHSVDHSILDIGALAGGDGMRTFHGKSLSQLQTFLSGTRYVIGHNILHHDLPALHDDVPALAHARVIDTLYWSALLFPERVTHALGKEEKLDDAELNNPVNDCKKARDLFEEEILAFDALDRPLQLIFYSLLKDVPEFEHFFRYLDFTAKPLVSIEDAIHERLHGKICERSRIAAYARVDPIALAFVVSLLAIGSPTAMLSPWILQTRPAVTRLLQILCNTPCEPKCPYCQGTLDIVGALKKHFGHDEYRTYNGEALQERAVAAAVKQKSLLVVFPTGGGKSITFQVPALMAGETVRGLTVVIVPLLSLMKDQIDNLRAQGITRAVTINSMLSPTERADAVKQVENGHASLLYISPELLRSKSIERLLMTRNVVRFVIDEAHCFSAWGQDFRVDYLYIGKFIKALQEKKSTEQPIAISCFTATAKQKVVSDICEYFRTVLGLDLEIVSTQAERENLHYSVLYRETENEKYYELCSLIHSHACPTIVYVSRTKKAEELAERLQKDGFEADVFHGKRTPREKVEAQDAFIKDETQVMVATSAFGMGVDKKDVGLVVHYTISGSLEDYLQESGRAGRDKNIEADCYVLFNEHDLDQHFDLLNSNRLSCHDINRVWGAVKYLSEKRNPFQCSALEIARLAGWDDGSEDFTTKVTTALSALENAGFIVREENSTRVFANSISMNNAMAAEKAIEAQLQFSEKDRQNALRVFKRLISNYYTAKAEGSKPETRVEFIADALQLSIRDVVHAIDVLREAKALDNVQDMTAYLNTDGKAPEKKVLAQVEKFRQLEAFLLDFLRKEPLKNERYETTFKALNQAALDCGLESTVVDLQRVISFWELQEYIKKTVHRYRDVLWMEPLAAVDELQQRFHRRLSICQFSVEWLYALLDKPVDVQRVQERIEAAADATSAVRSVDELVAAETEALFEKNEAEREAKKAKTNTKASALDKAAARKKKNDVKEVYFSLVSLFEAYEENASLMKEENLTLHDFEEALLYLHSIYALMLKGGFLVFYLSMKVKRLLLDNRRKYTQEHHKDLEDYYHQRIQQIHIVGEFANLMVSDVAMAKQFIHDYFYEDFDDFVSYYFQGKRRAELDRPVTASRYLKITSTLSDDQMEIINDSSSPVIVVGAGPGSGKTRLLVHKLASLYAIEEVKHEQLLMLTFSRAAMMEFRSKLQEILGKTASFIDVKTFHSYAFMLLGQMGTLEKSDSAVEAATAAVLQGQVDEYRLRKTALVIDEAQDMDAKEYAFVQALREKNPDMRVIAVGDDDQAIYGFRQASSKYLFDLLSEPNAKFYSLVDNYRSTESVVRLANAFVKQRPAKRLKSEPIFPVRKEPGRVVITEHRSQHMERALLAEMLETRNSTGSVAVLTNTNDEALNMVGLLLQNGINAKLVQSTDGFKLSDMAEIRYFLSQLDADESVAEQISKESWNLARAAMVKRYERSTMLEICTHILDCFSREYPHYYRTELMQFLYESHLEDFYEADSSTVLVSTIHKAKGREFDQVYLLLKDSYASDDDEFCKLYVGLTRAKNDLFIHVNTKLFRPYQTLQGVDYREDPTMYEAITDRVLQLTHENVYLDFGRWGKRQGVIAGLMSGTPLEIIRTDDGKVQLAVRRYGYTVPVIALSRAFVKELSDLERTGYTVESAAIGLMVWWQKRVEENKVDEPRDASDSSYNQTATPVKATPPEEILVALPELTLKRTKVVSASSGTNKVVAQANRAITMDDLPSIDDYFPD